MSVGRRRLATCGISSAAEYGRMCDVVTCPPRHGHHRKSKAHRARAAFIGGENNYGNKRGNIIEKHARSWAAGFFAFTGSDRLVAIILMAEKILSRLSQNKAYPRK